MTSKPVSYMLRPYDYDSISKLDISCCEHVGHFGPTSRHLKSSASWISTAQAISMCVSTKNRHVSVAAETGGDYDCDGDGCHGHGFARYNKSKDHVHKFPETILDVQVLQASFL